ncbi:hypothetical protein MPSEU_000222900 [Mayamaea pseudoterrestris]|nr:hypothetical protein MPSEU_000222900 [Mayamaea pseudoterrestris]
MVSQLQSARGGIVSRGIDLFQEKPTDAAKTNKGDKPKVREVHISVIDARDNNSTNRSIDTQRTRNATCKTFSNTSDTINCKSILEQNYIGSRHMETGVKMYQDRRYNKALREFEMALSMQCAMVGEKYIGVALALGNIGAAYLQLGNLLLAHQCLEESLAMKEKLAPKLLIADTLSNLGNCANLRGDLTTSLKYYQLALQDLRMKNGSAKDMANALYNIGQVECQQNNLEEAKTVLSEAWTLTKQAYGQNNAFAVQTLDLIGYVQLNMGEYDAAMVSFTKSLGILRRMHGPIHFEVANSLFNVSMVREARGELQDAWESYATTRDVYDRLKTDTSNPRYVAVMTSIAKVECAIRKANNKAKTKCPTSVRLQTN